MTPFQPACCIGRGAFHAISALCRTAKIVMPDKRNLLHSHEVAPPVDGAGQRIVNLEDTLVVMTAIVVASFYAGKLLGRYVRGKQRPELIVSSSTDRPAFTPAESELIPSDGCVCSLRRKRTCPVCFSRTGTTPTQAPALYESTDRRYSTKFCHSRSCGWNRVYMSSCPLCEVSL